MHRNRNRSLALALLTLVTLVTLAGCASQDASEEEVSTSSDSALESITDAPAEVPEGAKPKVETIDLNAIDLSKIDFDLDAYKRGDLDRSKLKIDVLDTGTSEHDYYTRSGNQDLKWVESDHRELPAFVDKIAHGIDVGGGKCRIQSLSLKKVVVGCRWTW